MPLTQRFAPLALLLLANSCHHAYPEGRYPCAHPGSREAAPECPPEWFCREDSRCWSTPSLSDAAVSDASAADAGIDADQCMPTVPSTELCDGIDNDCDGTVDGPGADAMCGAGAACDGGHCGPVFRGVSTAENAAIIAAAVDDAGNSYVAAQYASTVNLGTGPHSSAGGIDWLIASYAPSGTLRWAQAFGGMGAGSTSLAVFASPTGTIDLGSGPSASSFQLARFDL